MSLPSLWSWLQTASNLQVHGKTPQVNGFINYRGQVLYARLVYESGVIRVIARSEISSLEVRVASESGDFQASELETLRKDVKQLLAEHLNRVGRPTVQLV